MAQIECYELDKTFGKILVLDTISFQAELGELVILKGHSRSGKTTLLSVLAGLTDYENGKCYLLGQELSNLSLKEKVQFRKENIGFSFSHIKLLDELSLLENVSICLTDNLHINSNLLEIGKTQLKQFGLLEKKHFYPINLTSSEIQLALIARALITLPKILLLDDIFQNLDHVIAVKIMTILWQLALDRDITIVLSSNDPRLLPFAHKIIKMQSGKVVDVKGSVSQYPNEYPFLKI